MKKILLILLFAPIMAFAQAPANDLSCNAINLTVQTSFEAACTNVNFSMLNATYTATNINTGCGVSSKPDVWFKFTVPAGASVQIYTSIQAGSPNNDAIMQVFKGSDCNALTYITCNDDGTSFMPSLALTNQAPGELIFVKIVQFNGGTNGLYNICVFAQLPLNPNSKVGIGLAQPDSTLDVNGSALIRGAARVLGPVRLENVTAGNLTTNTFSTTDMTVFNLTVADQLILNMSSNQPGTVLAGSGGVGVPSYFTFQAFYKEFDVFNNANVVVPSPTGSKKLGFNFGTPGGFYSAVDSMITIPEDGLYMFMVKITVSAVPGGGGSFSIDLLRAGGLSGETFFIGSSSTPAATHTFTFTRQCTWGQKFYLAVTNTTGSSVTLRGSNNLDSYFKGYLLK